MRRVLLLAIFLLVAAAAFLAFYELQTYGPNASKNLQGTSAFFSQGPIAAQVVAPPVVSPSPTPSNTPTSNPTSSPSATISDNTESAILSQAVKISVPTPTSTPLTTAPQIDISALEKQIHDGINAERVGLGMTPLVWDQALNTIARQHSEDMAARGYFDHTTPEGLSPGDRYAAAGYTIKNGYAENIFMCPMVKVTMYRNGVLISKEYFSQEEIAQVVMNGWINSPGHLQNILNDYLPDEGIGIAISSDGNIYITEDFG